MSVDVSTLSLQDALALQSQVQAHLQISVEQQKEQLREGIRALAQVTNRSVASVVSDLFPVTPAPVKYRDPGNPKNAWSGKGMQPKWLKEAIAAGNTLESFQV
jgi:DNA-binding protein H-NS